MQTVEKQIFTTEIEKGDEFENTVTKRVGQ